MREMDKDRLPEALGHKVVGFDSIANIASAACAYLSVSPQIPFRGERLLIPNRLAEYFQIRDIRVGRNSQTLCTGSIPASVFTIKESNLDIPRSGLVIDSDGLQRGERFDLDICDIGMDLIIEVINIDVVSHRFLGAITGREMRVFYTVSDN